MVLLTLLTDVIYGIKSQRISVTVVNVRISVSVINIINNMLNNWWWN